MSDPEGGEEPERMPCFLYRNLKACLFIQRKGSEACTVYIGRSAGREAAVRRGAEPGPLEGHGLCGTGNIRQAFNKLACSRKSSADSQTLTEFEGPGRGTRVRK